MDFQKIISVQIKQLLDSLDVPMPRYRTERRGSVNIELYLLTPKTHFFQAKEISELLPPEITHYKVQISISLGIFFCISIWVHLCANKAV